MTKAEGATGTALEHVGSRFPRALIDEIDEWRASLPVGTTQSKAILALTQMGMLAVKGEAKRSGKGKR